MIFTEGPFLPNLIGSTFTIEGSLDDSRSVYSSDLLLLREEGFDPAHLEFSLNGSINIGESLNLPFNRISFLLNGLYKGSCDLNHGGYKIEIAGYQKKTDSGGHYSHLLKIPIEGLTLSLESRDASFLDYEEQAIQIMHLLSLTLGRYVTTDRRYIIRNQNISSEYWRNMAWMHSHSFQVIPDSRIEYFLQQTLPVWTKLSKHERKEISLAIKQINLSGVGYCEAGIFTIMQTWEMLANLWIQRQEIDPLIADLRKRVKATYREWKKNDLVNDQNGYWGGRILFPFDWARLKAQLESLASTHDLDLVKIGLDFEQLKNARDSVAYTCHLPEDLSENIDMTSVQDKNLK